MDEMFAPYGNIVTSRILCDLQTGIPIDKSILIFLDFLLSAFCTFKVVVGL